MEEQCLRYDNDDFTAVYIYKNDDITQIPAKAFTGATYLEVSWHTIQMIYSAGSLLRGQFLQNHHKIHTIARPLGRDMVCAVCVFQPWLASVNAVMYAVSCYTGSRYIGNQL